MGPGGKGDSLPADCGFVEKRSGSAFPTAEIYFQVCLNFFLSEGHCPLLAAH